MDSKKQTFTKPEANVIKFEKNDIISTSIVEIGPVGGEDFIDAGDVEDNE